MTQHTILTDRAVLAVSGEDAKAFLQGLITNDIHKVVSGKALFAAFLTPQGKFLTDFFINEQEGKLLLETDKSRLPELTKKLMMYRLRSKVVLEELPQLQVAAVWGGEEKHNGMEYADPRLPELGRRVIGTNLSMASEVGDYHQHRLSLGVPEGSKDLIPDRSLILEYGYDELNAIDFSKGCYVGQEVTARTKHRATLRKFIHQVTADKILPEAGTLVLANEREVGVMASSNGSMGLALLRVEDVKGAPLTCGGAPLTAKLPNWCNTSFAEAVK